MTISMGHQLKVLITVVLMVAVVSGGWLLAIQPALDSASAAETSRQHVRAQNDAMLAQLTVLEAAHGDLPALQEELGRLTASIPYTDDSSALLQSIEELARKAGVVVDGVTLADAQPYAAPQPVEAGSAAAATVESADIVPGVTEPPNPLMPATDERITPANFVLVPVTVAVSGSFNEVLDFVEGVQTGSRLFLVHQLSSSADAEGDGSTVKASVGGYVYALLG
jgi:Tfp pilus assembly protein PilO